MLPNHEGHHIDGKITLNWGEHHVLNIFTPEDWHCKLGRYRSRKPNVGIVMHSNYALMRPLGITFFNATYFEGPLYWIGGCLSVGTEEEYIKLRQRMGVTKGALQQELTRNIRLFRFSTDWNLPYHVQIVAQANIHVMWI